MIALCGLGNNLLAKGCEYLKVSVIEQGGY